MRLRVLTLACVLTDACGSGATDDGGPAGGGIRTGSGSSLTEDGSGVSQHVNAKSGGSASAGGPGGVGVPMHELPRSLTAQTSIRILCLEGALGSRNDTPVERVGGHGGSVHGPSTLAGDAGASEHQLSTEFVRPRPLSGLGALVNAEEVTVQLPFQFVDDIGPQVACMPRLQMLHLHVCCEEIGAPRGAQRCGVLSRLWPHVRGLPMHRGVRVTSRPLGFPPGDA